ncbi:MAG: TOBE domain-containing protein [Methanobacteriaceae archaeon]|jgi:molybdopterin-binding protein|nr:TOBE domain-containing protein [Methanobacteriaceae archaeon]OPY23757.1 MAG: DNA-binding transcriptional regulator ModE [Methanobacterium sp. PtaU1.Bin097]
MKISARNMLKGTVEDVELGAVMASIKIEVDSPGLVTALITKESAEKLGLKKGDKVTAIIKATEVMVGKE